ncbi:hypothetical protein IKM56_02605 [Candidatus Saccharibacteria bacterium]|nr:hypothetical protein [Candidatus Saccharibacteria bacterium]
MGNMKFDEMVKSASETIVELESSKDPSALRLADSPAWTYWGGRKATAVATFIEMLRPFCLKAFNRQRPIFHKYKLIGRDLFLDDKKIDESSFDRPERLENVDKDIDEFLFKCIAYSNSYKLELIELYLKASQCKFFAKSLLENLNVLGVLKGSIYDSFQEYVDETF